MKEGGGGRASTGRDIFIGLCTLWPTRADASVSSYRRGANWPMIRVLSAHVFSLANHRPDRAHVCLAQPGQWALYTAMVPNRAQQGWHQSDCRFSWWGIFQFPSHRDMPCDEKIKSLKERLMLSSQSRYSVQRILALNWANLRWLPIGYFENSLMRT